VGQLSSLPPPTVCFSPVKKRNLSRLCQAVNVALECERKKRKNITIDKQQFLRRICDNMYLRCRVWCGFFCDISSSCRKAWLTGAQVSLKPPPLPPFNETDSPTEMETEIKDWVSPIIRTRAGKTVLSKELFVEQLLSCISGNRSHRKKILLFKVG